MNYIKKQSIMKKIILSFLIITSVILFENNVFSQVFEIRAIENDMGYLEVQMRETSGTGTPTTTTPIAQISFEIRWSNTSAADVAILCATNHYTIGDGLTAKQNHVGDGLFWRNFTKQSASPVYAATDWTQNIWETIAIFKVTGTPASTENFDIAPSGWVPQDLVWAQGTPAVAYFPTPTGSVSNYPFPTIVYDHVWNGSGASGGTITNWAHWANWDMTCGGFAGPPNSGSNVYIPGTVSAFPSTNGSGTMACNNLRIGTGASLTVPATNGSLAIASDLFSYGTLTIVPNADATVTGSTYIDAAEGLVVQADATGVGSFINDLHGPGTPITYGASGSAKVQTHMTNGAAVNSFYMHLMGPTLDEENYTGIGTGADLSAFNVAPGNTYAYSWSETANAWVSQFSNTYSVKTTDGIGLSTDDATAYTMDMSGELIPGSVTSRTLTTITNPNSYEMLSNPWPSAFEWDAFYGSGVLPNVNMGVIFPQYWIWDPSGGSYLAFSTGGSNMIQVGQAFFAETRDPLPTPSTVTFFNENRAHSNTPFRSIKTNWLTLEIAGGAYGYFDRTVIRFMEDGTNGFDAELEAIKWNSMYTNSTEIRSIAGDNTELSINTLPQLDLQGEMVSVPVHFQCGYEGEYTFTASDLESFEYGTEIWIEDRQDGNAWHHLSPGHDTYTFTAGPDDAHDRFIIHFFGPTGVDEFTAKNVLIYADNEYALIRNMTKNEVIESVYIYSLAGNTILHKQVPEQNNYRFFVSNHDGYYIVRVVTDKNIYTEKVFIH